MTLANEEIDEKRISISESLDSPIFENQKIDIVSNDGHAEPITIEAYDEFAEPIDVLSPVSTQGRNVDLSKQITGVSLGTVQTSDPRFEVDFDPDDPGNPKLWRLWKTGFILFCVSFSTLTVVLYSTAYTQAIPGMTKALHISSEILSVLGITTYLMGLAVGSLFLAPLSEMYGRRPVYIVAMAIFAILIVPTGVAKNLETILVVRFFGAFAGSAMISNAPGTISDITSGESNLNGTI
jgi:MFS transporter